MLKLKNMILWILIAHLGQSLAQNDVLVRNSLFSHRMLVLNGKVFSLAELYEGGRPTRNSLQVAQYLSAIASPMNMLILSPASRLSEQECANKRCVNRDVEELPSNKLITLKQLANKLIETASSSPMNPPVTFFMGEIREGKTTALKKIAHEIRSNHANHWTLYIDLKTLNSPPIPPSWLRLRWIVGKLIPERFQQLFLDLLDANPRKIKIFIDNINAMPDGRAAVTLLMQEFTNKGVQVIATGDFYTSTDLLRRNVDLNVYKLSEMTYSSTKQFVKNFIIEEMLQQFSNPSSHTILAIKYRVKEIAPVITTMLMQTLIPRQPEALQQLISSWMLDDDDILQKFIRRGQQIGLPMRVIGHMVLDKKMLYDSVISMLNGDRHIEEYGAVALSQALGEKEKLADNILSPFRKEIHRAIVKLKTDDMTTKFTNVIGGKIKFIYPDLVNYFAADFLASRLTTPERIYIIRKFLSERNYYRVLEFFNFDDRILDKLVLKEIVLASGALQPLILDNILSQGHGELFDTIIDVYLDNNKDDYLRKYFAESGTQVLGRHFVMQRTFGVLNTHQDFLEFHNRPDTDLPNRMDLLAVYDMPEAYERLIERKIIAPDTQQKLKLMKEGLTNSFPDPVLLSMIEDKDSNLFADPAQMLYHVIYESGELSRMALPYLMEKFDQSNIVIKQREVLLHVMRWNSPELLDTIMDGLGISLTAETVDETTLAVALDANPSPLYTPTDFWRKMHTLLSRSSVSFDLSSWMQDSEPMSISWTDARSEWFRVMLGAESIDESASSTDAAQIKFTPMDPSDSRFDLYLGRVKTIPSAQWGLKAETLALRRKLLVQKLRQNSWRGSLTELLVHYRSSLPLTLHDHLFFRKTIHLAIQHDGARLTEAHKIRILDTLRDNIGNVEDFADLNAILRHFLDDPSHRLYTRYQNVISRRLKTSTPNQIKAPSHLTVGERLIQTRIQFDRSLHDADEFVRLKDQLRTLRTPRGVLDCIYSGRSKRSIQKSPCDIIWEDLDKISDTKITNKNKIENIRVNSDRFLSKLSINEPKNIENVESLIYAVNELINRQENPRKITGNTRNLMKDVIKHPSFTEYRQYQRMKASVIKLSRFVGSKIHLPSKSVMLHAAVALPLLQEFVAAVSTCSQGASIGPKSCVSSVMSLGGSLGFAGTIYAGRYVPLMIRSFTLTALEMLPSAVPAFLRENIQLAGNIGVKFVGRFLGPALAGVSAILEIVNLVEASIAHHECSKSSSRCLSRQRANNIISIYFSCAMLVALGVTLIPGGQVIGLGLLAGLIVLRSLVLSVLDVVDFVRDYNTDFSENIRIFIHSFIGLPLPEDMKKLQDRTNWVAIVAKKIEDTLLNYDNHIVACGMGLGVIDNENIYSSYAVIDMSYEDMRNNYNLSRIPVKIRDDMMPLCFPERDLTQRYEKYSQYVKNANFSCRNALVIGQKERWKKAKNGQSTVLFNLQYVSKGLVIGSNNFNNVFSIYGSDSDLTILGSNGTAITDVYSILSKFFHGRLLMNSRAQNNFVDISTVDSLNLEFFWNTSIQEGQIKCDAYNKFYVMMRNGPIKFHLVGRKNMQDTFACNWCKNSRCLTHNDEDIRVDTGGGESVRKMDYIVDCKMSVMNPFSVMVGSDTLNAIYTSYLTLGGASAREEVDLSHAKLVKIQPRKSHYSLHFLNYPLLESTIVVTYSPTFKTLSWILQQNVSIQMQISVEPYLVTSPVSDPAEEAENTPTCTFMDAYNNVTITPVIRIPANETAPLNVTRFDVIGFVNSSRLTDVLAHFANINVSSGKFTVVTRLVDTQTNKTFMMGSRANDNFYIDSTVVFLSGSSGHDVYSWSQQSPRHVWIENSADDDALDTIVIPDQMCDFLTANWSSVKSDCCDTFDDDVTLICEHKTRVNSTQRIILQRYLEAAQYRHLIIYWKDTLYVIIPPAWLSKSKKEAESIGLGILFSLSDHRDQDVRLILTSDDRYLVLNETEITNPLDAFRYPNSLGHFNDVVIAQKIYQRGSSSVLLKNFLDDTGDISIEWFNFYIIVVNDWLSNNTKPKILTALDIQGLCSKSTNNPVSVKYYNINSEDRKIIPINHTTMGANDTVQLGIILVSKIPPRNMSVSATRDSLKLKIMEKEVSIGNWCSDAQNRLYGIEFRIDLLHEPVIIDNLQQLECNSRDTKNPLHNVVTEFRKKLKNAQELYQLSLVDSDGSRLIKCVGTILSEIFILDSIYKLFGFLDYGDQITFMHDNCGQLMAQNLKKFTFQRMKTQLKKAIEWSKFNEAITKQDFFNYKIFFRKFLAIKNCWKDLKKILIGQFNSSILSNTTALMTIEKSISRCKKIN